MAFVRERRAARGSIELYILAQREILWMLNRMDEDVVLNSDGNSTAFIYLYAESRQCENLMVPVAPVDCRHKNSALGLTR
jgi:hypothetical protein